MVNVEWHPAAAFSRAVHVVLDRRLLGHGADDVALVVHEHAAGARAAVLRLPARKRRLGSAAADGADVRDFHPGRISLLVGGPGDEEHAEEADHGEQDDAADDLWSTVVTDEGRGGGGKGRTFFKALVCCSSFSSSSTMALTSATENVPSLLVSYLAMCSSTRSSTPDWSMSSATRQCVRELNHGAEPEPARAQVLGW